MGTSTAPAAIIISRRLARGHLKSRCALNPARCRYLTLAQLFAKGPILITLLGGTGRRVKMGIEAPEQLAIRRKDVL